MARPSRTRIRLVTTTALAGSLAALSPAALANPQGGTVVGGSATIGSVADGRLDIHQHSQRAIINWDSFSIGAGEHTHFHQPSAGAIMLNRVIGSDASGIFGRLSADGQVWLVNPNGILFGRSAVIDVAGLLATTHDIADADFMVGRHVFQARPGAPVASVVNEGSISIRDAGLAAFVAPHVANHGVISARLGTVALASGAAFTLDLHGDRLFNLVVDGQALGLPADAAAAVENSGTILADGGRVVLSADIARGVVDRVIDTSGVIQAQSVAEIDGEIVLSGGPAGMVVVSGTLDVSGRDIGETGGTVTVLGEAVWLGAGARVDASGAAGGGTVLVGGDWQGRGETPRATRTVMAVGASIHADATMDGDGGTVVLWSDEHTFFGGNISARGGAQGGDGGQVETSGKATLQVLGTVDAGSAWGRAGLWLLDPHNVRLVDTAGMAVWYDPYLGYAAFNAGQDDSLVSIASITSMLESGTDVKITTGTSGTQNGDIWLDAPLTLDMRATNVPWFWLDAAGNIYLNNPIAVTNGSIDLQLTAGQSVVINADVTGVDDIHVRAGSGITLAAGKTAAASGNIWLDGVGAVTVHGMLDAGGDVDIDTSGDITVAAGAAIDTGRDMSVYSDGDIVIVGALRATGWLDVDADGDVTVASSATITSDRHMWVWARGGTLIIDGVVSAVDWVDLWGNSNLTLGGSVITLWATFETYGTLQLAAGSSVAVTDLYLYGMTGITVSGTLTAGDSIGLESSGAITVNSALHGRGLWIETTGNVLLNGDVGSSTAWFDWIDVYGVNNLTAQSVYTHDFKQWNGTGTTWFAADTLYADSADIQTNTLTGSFNVSTMTIDTQSTSITGTIGTLTNASTSGSHTVNGQSVPPGGSISGSTPPPPPPPPPAPSTSIDSTADIDRRVVETTVSDPMFTTTTVALDGVSDLDLARTLDAYDADQKRTATQPLSGNAPAQMPTSPSAVVRETAVVREAIKLVTEILAAGGSLHDAVLALVAAPGEMSNAELRAVFEAVPAETIVASLAASGDAAVSGLGRLMQATLEQGRVSQGEVRAALAQGGFDAETRRAYLNVYQRVRHEHRTNLFAAALSELKAKPQAATIFPQTGTRARALTPGTAVETGAAARPLAPELAPSVVQSVALAGFSPRGLAEVKGRIELSTPFARVHVNGRWVFVDDTGAFTAEVALDRGINEVEVEIIDEAGQVHRHATLIDSPRATPPAPPPPQKARRVAVLFAVSDYADPLVPPLETPAADVAAVAAALNEMLGYETRIVRNAGRDAIVEELRALGRSLGENDEVTVYYAGHGYAVEETGMGYWLPADAKAMSAEKWISNEDVARLLNRMPARHVMLVADSCYSGAFTREAQGMSAQILRDPDQVIERRAVMAMSSGDNEPVLDGDVNSPFAAELVRQVRGLAAASGGIELFQRVQQAVASDNPQTPQYGVVLSAGYDHGGDFLFLPPARSSDQTSALPSPARGAAWQRPSFIRADIDIVRAE